jgi:GNAT superfamily N-acetyltransferase
MGTGPVEARTGAAALLDAVRALRVLYFHERSFYMARETLLAERFLLVPSPAQLGPRWTERALDVCEAIGLPPKLREAAAGELRRARAVAFGFEGGVSRSTYKVYFEQHASDPLPGQPTLLHVAFKWDPADPSRHVVTHYHLHAGLRREQVLARMEGVCDGMPRAVVEPLAAVIELGCARADAGVLQYLEAAEADTSRRSFDFNLYGAEIALGEIAAPLARLGAHFALPPGRLDALCDPLRTTRLGHIAAGIHRDGAPFVTVYYGVEGHSGAAAGPPLEIRPLAASDSLEALTRLLHDAYAPLAAIGLNYTAADQSVEVTAERVSAGACFVAVSEGRVVGTVSVDHPKGNPACPYLGRPHVAGASQFAVAPSHQKRGIGSRLLEKAESWASANGYAELVLDTAEPARHLVALYERKGYRQVGFVQWEGKRYRSVLMAKSLAVHHGR